MFSLNLLLDELSILLSVAGAWLLFKEVSKAQEFEALDRKLSNLKENKAIYLTDLKEYWITLAMESSNWSRASAEDACKLLSDDDIRGATEEDAMDLFEQDLPEALAR